MRQLSRNILPSWMFHGEFWRPRPTEKGGPPHLWLQRREPREAVLIHHRCHHLKSRQKGVRALPALPPPPCCGFPRAPSFLPLRMILTGAWLQKGTVAKDWAAEPLASTSQQLKKLEPAPPPPTQQALSLSFSLFRTELFYWDEIRLIQHEACKGEHRSGLRHIHNAAPRHPLCLGPGPSHQPPKKRRARHAVTPHPLSSTNLRSVPVHLPVLDTSHKRDSVTCGFCVWLPSHGMHNVFKACPCYNPPWYCIPFPHSTAVSRFVYPFTH